MAQVLVLVDATGSATVPTTLGKLTAELLAAAARLGEPAAVVVGKPGTAESLAADLGALGAIAVYAAESDVAGGQLVTPEVAGLAAAAAAADPIAVLVPATVSGREIAGRLAVRVVVLGCFVDVFACHVFTRGRAGRWFTTHADGRTRRARSIAKASKKPSERRFDAVSG